MWYRLVGKDKITVFSNISDNCDLTPEMVMALFKNLSNTMTIN